MTVPSPFAVQEDTVDLPEEALETLAEAIEAATDGFAIVDDGGEHAFVNGAHHRTYGYSSPDALLGESWRLLYEEEEADRLEEEVAPELCSTGQWRGEAVGQRADGTTFPQEMSLSTFGEDTYVVCVARDVADRRREEIARRERAAQLRWERTLFDELVATAPVAIAVIDGDGEPTRVNARALEVLGSGRDDLVASSTTEVDWRVDYADDRSIEDGGPVARVLATGEAVTDELLVVDAPDDDRRLLDVNVSPVTGEDGAIERVVVTGQDVTEHHQSLQRLRQSNEQLERFAYIASHDMKEPLRMVSSFLRLLELRYGDDLDDEAREFLEFAVTGADRMRRMVDGLLEFSRISTEEAERRPTDVEGVLERVLDDLRSQLEETDAAVEVDSLPTVRGDPRQLQRLFQNLLSNAIKYSGDERPTVEITAERRGRHWEFEVSDRGIGVDLEDPDRIFDVFQRGHDDRNLPGTGIGLAVCRQIVTRHGGTIEVRSDAAEGTTFSFTLPAAEVEDDG